MIATLETTTTFAPIAPNEVVVGAVATPIGAFGAVFTARGLACLTFPGDPMPAQCEVWIKRHEPAARIVNEHPALAALSAQLTAYFEGALRHFTVPLDLRGTPFQVDVWQALLAIPYGEVRSYGEIAAVIGRPKAFRAVGMANHDNPVPIIVPCHRVIGSNRTLTGFGGGLDLKERLLRLEGVLLGEKETGRAATACAVGQP